VIKVLRLAALALLLATGARAAQLAYGISCDANCPGGSLIASATALGVTRIRLKVPMFYPLCDLGTQAAPHDPVCENATNNIDPAGLAPAGSGATWQLDGATGAPFSAIFHVGDIVSSAALPGLPGTATITAVSQNVPSVALDTVVSQYVHATIGGNTVATATSAKALGMSMELTLLNVSDNNNQDFGPFLESDVAAKARIAATIAAFQATGITIDLISVSAEEDAINNNPSTTDYLHMLDLVEAVAAPLHIAVTNGGLTNTGTALNQWDYLWETCATVACRRQADVVGAGAFIKSEFQSAFAANKLPTTCDGSGTFLTYGGNLYLQMRKYQQLVIGYAARPWMAYVNFHVYQVPPAAKLGGLLLVMSQTGLRPYVNQFNNYSASWADQMSLMAGLYSIGASGIEPTTATPGAAHAVSLQASDGTLLPSGVAFKAFIAAPTRYLLSSPPAETPVC